MTKKEWEQLKIGSWIKGRGEHGRIRRVLYKGYSTIRLRVVKDHTCILWSGKQNHIDAYIDATTYCECDRLMFDVIKF